MNHDHITSTGKPKPGRLNSKLSKSEVNRRKTLPRECSICNRVQPATKFSKVTCFWCRSCERLKAKKYRSKNAESRRIRQRRSHLRTTFGLTPLEYDLMLKDQGGVCAICKNPPSEKWRGRIRALAVDHDHVTGRIRGILCSKCNLILGACRDNPETLVIAADYLKSGGTPE